MARTVVLLVPVLMATAVGCCGTSGVRDARDKPRPDNPRYTTEEQMRRARDKYAVPMEDFRTGPRTGSELPGGVGR
jgi:hypothetical protein